VLAEEDGVEAVADDDSGELPTDEDDEEDEDEEDGVVVDGVLVDDLDPDAVAADVADVADVAEVLAVRLDAWAVAPR
jgi:hypothetical protein